MTPPADLVLVKMGETLVKQTDAEGELVTGWVVRAFPSKHPIVTPNAPASYGEYPHYSEPAVGYHYVVVATPKHDQPFSQMDIEQWTNVLATVQDKVRWLYAQRGVSYVVTFINHGKGSGETIEHAHLQIVTVPRLPPHLEAGGGDGSELPERARGLPDVPDSCVRERGAEADNLDRVLHRVCAVGLVSLLRVLDLPEEAPD